MSRNVRAVTLLRYVTGPAARARDAAFVFRGPLPPPLKRDVVRAQAWLQFGRTAAIRLGPLALNGFSRDTLAYLLRELFVELEYWFETPTRAPFIVDCGSNIGIGIAFFKLLYPEARIIGFEPDARNFALLQRNVGGLDNVALHEAAVGETDGPVTFYREPEGGAFRSSVIARRGGPLQTMVPQVRLSRFLDRHVDFLKIDVEGGEWGVLRDLIDSDRLSSVAQMVIEYHHHVEPGEDRLSAFLALLEGQGFGYQLRARSGTSWRAREFQDVLIYAYRKSEGPGMRSARARA